MNDIKQIFNIIKWILRLLIFVMFIVIIYDFSIISKIASDIGLIQHNMATLIHVLLFGIFTYGLVHYKDL